MGGMNRIVVIDVCLMFLRCLIVHWTCKHL